MIKVEACGICHGDALVKEGNPRYNIEYPRVPGHEVVGIIDQLGSNVMDWQIGQRVGVGWYGGRVINVISVRKENIKIVSIF